MRKYEQLKDINGNLVDPRNLNYERRISNLENYQKEYSTSEQKTNKIDVDGRPIYEMTFDGNCNDDAVLLTGVCNLIDYHGTASMSGLKRAIPYFEIWQNKRFGATINQNGDKIKTAFLLEDVSANSKIHITIAYTKLSDTPKTT